MSWSVLGWSRRCTRLINHSSAEIYLCRNRDIQADDTSLPMDCPSRLDAPRSPASERMLPSMSFEMIMGHSASSLTHSIGGVCDTGVLLAEA